jgi:DNA-binding LacI/PurR family transcriptional regulator
VATLYDVADRCGVSHTTVSNVYRHPHRVAPSTRERVEAAAAELGYGGPSAVAAGLRTGRVGAIGVVLTEELSYAFTDPAAIALLQGMAETYRDGGITVLPIGGGRRGTDAVLGAAIDGLVVYSVPCDNEVMAIARRRSLPYVLVDTDPGRNDLWVGIDDRVGARAAARHVLGLGHRRIAVLADRVAENRTLTLGHLGEFAFDASIDVSSRRALGYRDELVASGIDLGSSPFVDCGANSVAAGRRAMDALLDRTRGAQPTAVLAMSDELARGAIAAASARGLRIPTDISVMGFDDSRDGADDLTTIRQPLVEKGSAAAELLMDALDGKRPRSRRRTLPTQLVVRSTTGPVA